MSTIHQESKVRLRINAYDRASSWLVALLVVTGVTVLALVLMYFARQLSALHISPKVTPIASGGGGGGGGGGGAVGPESDLELPANDDLNGQFESQLNQTLTALTSAVNANTDLLANEQIDVQPDVPIAADANGRHSQGFGSGRGGGIGSGVGRGVGSGVGDGFGGGRGDAPEPKREFRFQPKDLNEYAEFLDYFEVELGALSPEDNMVYYASKLRRAQPDVRAASPDKEQRLFMNPQTGQFAALDRRLAEKAGIADKGQIIMQFYPAEAQTVMNNLERQYAEDHKHRPDQIRRTVFRVTHTGERFELKVEDQSYR